MRFLLDVHVSTSISRALAEDGHDILRAALSCREWSDERLLERAVIEERMVITQDSDFSDLIYAFGKPPPPAIIFIRYEPQDRVDIVRRVLDVLASDLLNNHMAVITPMTTRFRPLPNKSNHDA